MQQYLQHITKIESNTKPAFTKRHPAMLPIVLEAKRFFVRCRDAVKYSTCRTVLPTDVRWYNLAEHSSPLYRKFNTRHLDEAKINNIKIAINHLDEYVIQPGETFSFWKLVGRPTRAKGYMNGLVLSDGHLREGLGGGMCQLSNLVAYLFVCTECVFVERKHHARDVFPDTNRTVPFASGATIFFNLIDLKIKNTYSFPIKINLRVTDTQLRGSVSAQMPLDHFIKLEERNACFIRSSKTGFVYRCNEIYRVFYTKNTKQKIKEVFLWRNVARVLYAEEEIKDEILDF